MFLQEPRNNIGAKGERDTAIVLAPAGDVLVGIRPQQVAEQATVRNLDIVSTGSAPCNRPMRRNTEIRGWCKRHTSVGRMTLRICSIEFKSGLRPPCIVKIFSSMMAAIGRQLKQSVNVFHSLML